MDVVDAVGQFLQITFRPLLDVFRNFTKLTKKRIRDGDFASSAGRWLCPQLISQMDKITNLVREDRDDLLLEYRNAYLSESKFTDLKVCTCRNTCPVANGCHAGRYACSSRPDWIHTSPC